MDQAGQGRAVAGAAAVGARSVRADVRAALACALVDGLPSPVFVVDADGMPLLVNRAAARHVAAGDGLLVQPRVEAIDRDSGVALRLAIGAACADGGVAAVVRVVRRPPRRPLRVVVAPLRGALPATGADGPRGAVLAFHDPDDAIALDAGLLRRYFGLTPTEARITIGLAAGQSLRDIAAAHGMALGTVRWHLKRVLPKLDARSQAELVARVLCSPLRLVGLLPPPLA